MKLRSIAARWSHRFLTKVAPWLERPHGYLLATALLTLSIPVWMALAQVDRVVRVEGRVIPAAHTQQIQHLEGGIVAGIEVSEGSIVRKGDLLLTIDDTTSAANLEELRIRLDSQRARAARLEAEAHRKAAVAFPADIVTTGVLDAERRLFEARRARLEEEVAAHAGAIAQRTSDIAQATEMRVRLSVEHDTALQRLEVVQRMAARKAASRLEVLEAQGREQRLRTEIGEAEGALPKLRAAIAEERAKIASAHAEFAAQATNELAGVLSEIDTLRQRFANNADRQRRTEIRASSDGVINRIATNTVGGVVKPGETIIELTPTDGGLVIEARAQPRDRGFLHTGLPAQIRVSAFDPGDFGALRGRVTEVSGDSIPDQRSEPYYRVNILVQSLPDAFSGHELVPGMTVTADVVTGRRSVLAYVLAPVRRFSYSIFRDPR